MDKLKELPFDKPFKYRPVSERKRRAYSVQNNASKGSYLEMNDFIIHEVCPEVATNRVINNVLPWSLGDMIGVEQSASYMAEVQNYLSWLVGGIIHRLREMQPESFDKDSLMSRMLKSLTTAVSHLASETFGLRALAVVRRREHALSFFPRRYSAEDRGVLRATSWDDPTLFADQVARSVDERTASRSSKLAFDKIVSQASYKPKGRDKSRQRQPHQQQQQQAPSSSQRQHGSSSLKPPSSSSARQPSPRRKENPSHQAQQPPTRGRGRSKSSRRGRKSGFRR